MSVSLTNHLRDYVREKKFREDLYYRLSVFELVVPPLRDRGDDIEMLMEHFFAHFRKQHGRPNLRISPASRKLLKEYAWPGNRISIGAVCRRTGTNQEHRRCGRIANSRIGPDSPKDDSIKKLKVL